MCSVLCLSTPSFYLVQSYVSLYLGFSDFALRFVGLQTPTVSFGKHLFSSIMVPAQETTVNTNDRLSAVNTHSLSTPSAVNTLYLQFTRGGRDGIQLQIQISMSRCLHVGIQAPIKSTEFGQSANKV